MIDYRKTILGIIAYRNPDFHTIPEIFTNIPYLAPKRVGEKKSTGGKDIHADNIMRLIFREGLRQVLAGYYIKVRRPRFSGRRLISDTTALYTIGGKK